MAASCLLRWYQFIALMCASLLSLVSREIMFAMVYIRSPKQSPPAPSFLECLQQFFLCYIPLAVLDHQRHSCPLHLPPSQVIHKLHKFLVSRSRIWGNCPELEKILLENRWSKWFWLKCLFWGICFTIKIVILWVHPQIDYKLGN